MKKARPFSSLVILMRVTFERWNPSPISPSTTAAAGCGDPCQRGNFRHGHRKLGQHVHRKRQRTWTGNGKKSGRGTLLWGVLLESSLATHACKVNFVSMQDQKADCVSLVYLLLPRIIIRKEEHYFAFVGIEGVELNTETILTSLCRLRMTILLDLVECSNEKDLGPISSSRRIQGLPILIMRSEHESTL